MKVYDKEIYEKQESMKFTLLIIVVFLVGFFAGYLAKSFVPSKDTNTNSPEGMVINVIGHKDDPNDEITAIVHDFKIRDEFDKDDEHENKIYKRNTSKCLYCIGMPILLIIADFLCGTYIKLGGVSIFISVLISE